jgi:hypothetical protein
MFFGGGVAKELSRSITKKIRGVHDLLTFQKEISSIFTKKIHISSKS